MVWIQRLCWLVAMVLLLMAAAAGVYVQRSLPQLDGELPLPGLQAPVKVERDAADITHLRAQSARDAWFALGYVHAQERGWQLAFNRRLMRGQLSEVLGEATVETDKLLRTLGIMRAAERQLQGLPPEAQAALQAYADGINGFYTHSTQVLPPEFHLVRTGPLDSQGQAWSPVDSVAWSLMMALDLGGNWGNELARLSVAQVLDSQRLWQLMPPYPGEKPATAVDLPALYARLGVYRRTPEGQAQADADTNFVAKNDRATRTQAGFDSKFAFEGDASALAHWSRDFVASAGTVDGKGSNNWVVAGSHTASGKPLLANDPHLGLSAPAIWYFARLQAPASTLEGVSVPPLDVVGATLPGLPFVVLGRTRGLAWGFTNTGPDTQDLYLEQIHPTNPAKYRVPARGTQPQWTDFEQREETVRVKDRPDLRFTVRSTRHGPVLSDVQKGLGELIDTRRYVLALRWAALEADNRTVLAGFRGNHAHTVIDLMRAYADYHSPMQNVVVADTGGQIFYKAVGKVPLRRADNDLRGTAPAPGWEPRYDWAGWLALAQTPQDEGRKGWVATANQRITPSGYPHFIGQDWAPPERFDRIEQRLAEQPRHDRASMQSIQADVLSLATQRLLPALLAARPSHALGAAALAALQGFDARMRSDSAAALIFAVWADELTRGLIEPRLGAAKFKAMYGKRHLRHAVESALATQDPYWCGEAGCPVQVNAALDRALARLQQDLGNDLVRWQWGQWHVALSGHRPLGKVPLLARWFDVQTPSAGDTFTVNVGQYWANEPTQPFANRHAASLRAVYDLADLEKSQFIYQTGQSGLVFSSRYRDMARAWSEVRYRPMMLEPAEIAHTLTLRP